jgi:hypothetical protein
MADALVEYRIVHDAEQLRWAITSLVADGYHIANQTEVETTLFKRKEFSTLWLIVGLLLCVVPLLIYLLIYALEKDSMVIIQLRPRPVPGQSPMPRPEDLAWTPDRSHWWDGERWHDPTERYPASAPLSGDGSTWWDGTTWRPKPPAAQPWRGGWDEPA